MLVADVSVDRPLLGPDDRHHVQAVLRLGPGDEVVACDGRGAWRVCRLPALVRARDEAEPTGLEPTGAVEREPRRAPMLTVAFVPAKGERPEWVVQKLTEVGVDRISVLTSARSVVRWEGTRAERSLSRLRRVAREAAMQSRRKWLPEVLGPISFETAVGHRGAGELSPGTAAGVGVALAHTQGGVPLRSEHHTVLTGPEGGWAPGELAAAEEAGATTVALGAHVLRAETAAVVAGALACALREGLVAPGG
ncbi:MAG: RsmE family RNA methyltransferase [Acidimicrobiales bacterium]